MRVSLTLWNSQESKLTLHDYLNEQEIISAMSEIMELSNGGVPFKSDRDQIIEILNEYFNTNKVSMVRVLTDMLDSNGYVIEDQNEVIHILVKYFGIPKNKINHKERSKIMEEDFPVKKITKWVVIGLIGLFVLITCINSCSVVGPTERGVTVTLGQVKDVLEPGIHFKAPFVSKIKKYDTTPIPYKKSLGINTDAAVTADKQSIGIDYELYWKYKGNISD